jgi:hypothetical protein
MHGQSSSFLKFYFGSRVFFLFLLNFQSSRKIWEMNSTKKQAWWAINAFFFDFFYFFFILSFKIGVLLNSLLSFFNIIIHHSSFGWFRIDFHDLFWLAFYKVISDLATQIVDTIVFNDFIHKNRFFI